MYNILFSRRLVIGRTLILTCDLLKELRELGWVPYEDIVVIVVARS